MHISYILYICIWLYICIYIYILRQRSCSSASAPSLCGLPVAFIYTTPHSPRCLKRIPKSSFFISTQFPLDNKSQNCGDEESLIYVNQGEGNTAGFQIPFRTVLGQQDSNQCLSPLQMLTARKSYCQGHMRLCSVPPSQSMFINMSLSKKTSRWFDYTLTKDSDPLDFVQSICFLIATAW